jgi:transcriptional regulator with XRE-family HTH domain
MISFFQEATMEPYQRMKFVRAMTPFGQQEMANVLDCSQAYYAQMESGKASISKSHAMTLGKALGFNASWLLEGTSPITEKPALFLSVPASGLHTLTKLAWKRKITETRKVFSEYLLSFMKENTLLNGYRFAESPSHNVYLLNPGCMPPMILSVTDEQMMTIIDDTLRRENLEASKCDVNVVGLSIFPILMPTLVNEFLAGCGYPKQQIEEILAGLELFGGPLADKINIGSSESTLDNIVEEIIRGGFDVNEIIKRLARRGYLETTESSKE